MRLLPLLVADNVGLVTVCNNHWPVSLHFWRSVFERRAPQSLAHIEQSVTPIKQGNTVREVSDELLEALTMAYKEAVSKELEA